MSTPSDDYTPDEPMAQPPPSALITKRSRPDDASVPDAAEKEQEWTLAADWKAKCGPAIKVIGLARYLLACIPHAPWQHISYVWTQLGALHQFHPHTPEAEHPIVLAIVAGRVDLFPVLRRRVLSYGRILRAAERLAGTDVIPLHVITAFTRCYLAPNMEDALDMGIYLTQRPWLIQIIADEFRRVRGNTRAFGQQLLVDAVSLHNSPVNTTDAECLQLCIKAVELGADVRARIPSSALHGSRHQFRDKTPAEAAGWQQHDKTKEYLLSLSTPGSH
jgi:hypothetical protein